MDATRQVTVSQANPTASAGPSKAPSQDAVSKAPAAAAAPSTTSPPQSGKKITARITPS
ncbi:hypothetical protein H072_2931 [Dactylellina haptotyla CBS 200.50]|uniref:Uncharacterized protein n=1 Tax=Dactylellina haptotyla (strain CBS 200.50) TaxID=1284197 RepID=S8AJI3_DACHA|nr:hypothetical protein H072_2931 [Dactylellina haptotyla CBS 200.50]